MLNNFNFSGLLQDIGDPFIAIPIELKLLWNGASGLDPTVIERPSFGFNTSSNSPTDYDRACDATGYGSVVQVGAGWCFATGEYNYGVCWGRFDGENDLYLFQSLGCDSGREGYFVERMVAAEASDWIKISGSLLAVRGKLLLMHASIPGGQAVEQQWPAANVNSLVDSIVSEVIPGEYSIDTLNITCDENPYEEVVFHRFYLTRLNVEPG